jgi:hypothetical protein
MSELISAIVRTLFNFAKTVLWLRMHPGSLLLNVCVSHRKQVPRRTPAISPKRGLDFVAYAQTRVDVLASPYGPTCRILPFDFRTDPYSSAVNHSILKRTALRYDTGTNRNQPHAVTNLHFEPLRFLQPLIWIPNLCRSIQS